jgi:hypothetical protein
MIPKRLRKNHRTRTPGAIITVDTESFERQIEGHPKARLYPLRLGVARYARLEGTKVTRQDTCEFTSAAAFWDWCRSKLDRRRVTWLWAHNLGWDLTVLKFWAELEFGRFTLEGPPRKMRDSQTGKWELKPTRGLLISEDPPTAFVVWDQRLAKLKGCDTFNWYRCSLKELGEMVGLPKLDFPGVTSDEATLWTYCRRDAEITERVVLDLLNFVRVNDLGNFRYTPGAQSFATFRHWSDEGAIEFQQDDRISEFERLAYFGGRKSVFFAGEVRSPAVFALDPAGAKPVTHPVDYGGPVHQLDLSAAYPAVMLDNLFPCRMIYKRTAQKPYEVLAEMKHHGCLAWVSIESYETPYPVKKKDRTDWCTGVFQTGLCGPELLAALRMGHVTWVHRAIYYRLAKLFTEFVTKLTDLELQCIREHATIKRQLAKLLRNSLYGKFGQRSTGWEVVDGQRWMDPWGMFQWSLGPDMGYELRRAIGYRVQRRLSGPRVEWTFPAISAYVSSYARVRMDELIQKAGPFQVYYLDTDAIHVSQRGHDNLVRCGEVHADCPGKLREVARCDSVHYYAPKHFRWGDRVINAGLHRRSVACGPSRFSVEDFQHLESTLARRPLDGGVVTTREVAEPVHQLCARRTPTGWTVPLSYIQAGENVDG